MRVDIFLTFLNKMEKPERFLKVLFKILFSFTKQNRIINIYFGTRVF